MPAEEDANIVIAKDSWVVLEGKVEEFITINAKTEVNALVLFIGKYTFSFFEREVA